MEIRQRRIYPREFKSEAVKLVLEQGYSNAKAAHELGLPTKTLANWVRDARRSARTWRSESRCPRTKLDTPARITRTNGRQSIGSTACSAPDP